MLCIYIIVIDIIEPSHVHRVVNVVKFTKRD